MMLSSLVSLPSGVDVVNQKPKVLRIRGFYTFFLKEENIEL